MVNKFHVRYLSISARCFKKITPDNLKTKPKGISSQHWLSRQLSDPYVEKAKRMNLRCRSAFKLIEIDDRFKILKPGHIVIDCGAAPGSWTQVVVKKVNANGSDVDLPRGIALAIDKQQMYPIEGATIFGNRDFTRDESQKEILKYLEGQKVDVVISDMAPSATGIRTMDNQNMLNLCYSALRFALEISKTGASLLMKMWQCGETKQLETDIYKFYDTVNIIKPKSSRSDSTEIFLLGRRFKGLKINADK